jgi:PAS domain S-box-containing protein
MASSAPEAGSIAAQHRGTGELAILLADDDETDRLAVRRRLHQSGLPVLIDEAGSAQETLRLVRGKAYDCVLLDYYLRDMPGMLLLKKLRAAAADVPIVVFAGRGDEDIAVELMKSGAADYLPKASMTPERLAAAVRHAMELARAAVAKRQAEEALRAQESRFRTLANAIPQMAWMTDTEGARYWFNQRWFDYTGASFEEVKGWGWQRVHHPDHVERVTRLIKQSCATGDPWEDTYPIRGRDGAYRWFLSRALPIRDAYGAIVGWLGTNTDVTDQKNAEAERERLLQLEHKARARAERATKARDELMAIVAHDLRNPLQIIMTAATKLQPALTGEHDRQYLGFIQQSAHQMERLVRDLLDVSSIESESFSIRLEPVELRPLLEEARKRFDLAAQEQRITLECTIEADIGSVIADRDRLSQVVGNLLATALKFTPKGGRVSLGACRRAGDVEIVVADTGRGIRPEDLPRVFDRFWRGDRTRGGAGLGLTICKGIVEAHDGRIWAESRVGAGSVFRVRIPAAPAAAGGATQPRTPAAGSSAAPSDGAT